MPPGNSPAASSRLHRGGCTQKNFELSACAATQSAQLFRQGRIAMSIRRPMRKREVLLIALCAVIAVSLGY
ncbi:MAG TPA: hypothetical protein VHE37_06910 [Nevskiaceae bacterium]|nr:hypothetical protein [Nevskiaceae bacterium]